VGVHPLERRWRGIRRILGNDAKRQVSISRDDQAIHAFLTQVPPDIGKLAVRESSEKERKVSAMIFGRPVGRPHQPFQLMFLGQVHDAGVVAGSTESHLGDRCESRPAAHVRSGACRMQVSVVARQCGAEGAEGSERDAGAGAVATGWAECRTSVSLEGSTVDE
jgi:hypothetical protein